MGVVALAVGVLPVLLFLAALRLLDSFKLVGQWATCLSISAGALAALAALVLNSAAMATLAIEPTVFRRYVAPIVEELLKSGFLVWLIMRAKVGFVVDAAIHGFALGTGFAVVENVYYAQATPGSEISLWLVRGLGTAVMHGSTTAVVGILSKTLADLRGSATLSRFLPGLAVAAGIHSLYNHFVLNPLLSAMVLLVVMPLLVMAVFERSERATRVWLGTGLDGEVEILESISSGSIAESRIGIYLNSLRQRFAGPVVGDMLCYLQVHLELAVRAKGVLLARSAGVDLPIESQVLENLRELRFLERAMGPTGKAAVLPLLRTSSRDLWQIYMLGSAAGKRRTAA